MNVKFLNEVLTASSLPHQAPFGAWLRKAWRPKCRSQVPAGTWHLNIWDEKQGPERSRRESSHPHNTMLSIKIVVSQIF